jgi:hypothetical protein
MSGQDIKLDHLDPTKQQILHQHANEISSLSTPSTGPSPPRAVSLKKHPNDLLAAIHYIHHTITNYVFALLTSPQTVFADPVGTIFALIVIPPLHIALFVVQVMFLVGGWLGAGKVIDWFSKEYGYGYSAVNMLYPSIFDDSTAIPIHTAARSSLNNPYAFPSTSQQPSQDAPPARYFNLDIAKSLLVLCALVYERDDQYVIEAGKVAKARDDLSLDETHDQIARLLLQSTQRISSQADKWDFNFCAVSDLVSTGGPFCGLFWPKHPTSPDEKWIILVFKGTSPTNFSEFMVDATIQQQNAQRFFGNGSVHQGFYTSLVPGPGAGDPYGHILRSLKGVAKSLKTDGDGGGKVNLWITGHSLGAALSSLFYARLLFSPGDLGDDLVLRQGYMYGTPRVADAELINAFDFTASLPYGYDHITSSMWIVADRWDIVPRVPIGLANDEENGSVLPQTSLLNYGHFSTAGLKLTRSSSGRGWKLQRGSLAGGSKMQVVQSYQASGIALATAQPPPPKMMDLFGFKIDPIGLMRWLISLVVPIYDHFPENYYVGLQQMKPDLVV